jgi:hypothetical protein
MVVPPELVLDVLVVLVEPVAPALLGLLVVPVVLDVPWCGRPPDRERPAHRDGGPGVGWVLTRRHPR